MSTVKKFKNLKVGEEAVNFVCVLLVLPIVFLVLDHNHNIPGLLLCLLNLELNSLSASHNLLPFPPF
jgi:hypothetical protein